RSAMSVVRVRTASAFRKCKFYFNRRWLSLQRLDRFACLSSLRHGCRAKTRGRPVLGFFVIFRVMVNFLRFLSPKRKPAAEAPVWQAVDPANPNGGTSALLTDVLGEKAASDPSSRPAERKTAPSPLSQRLSVGARLAESKRQITETASKLI